MTNLEDMVAFAEAWTELGPQIQEQVQDVINDSQAHDVNPAAIEEARRKFREFPEMMEVLDTWMEFFENGGPLKCKQCGRMVVVAEELDNDICYVCFGENQTKLA